MKIKMLLFIFVCMAFCLPRVQAQDKLLTADSCQIYISLNDPDATNYPFNLNLNGKPVTVISNLTRMIYTVKSTCKITLSDNGHKPFFDIVPGPGKKYYLQLTKSFAGRYYEIKQYRTQTEVQDYLHFVFWTPNAAGINTRPLIGDQRKDQIHTVIMEENMDHPLCE